MKAKTRRALLYIFMSLFILTMFTASLTLGRYSAELESDGDYQGDYEYILTDTLVVNSVDEFFDAIENGYSNIQIGDNVDNPLIIAGDINDVRTDLTIDLNGHEIQRNNRDPLLNVDDGITLTIIDSKGGGSLYNPVGSVLRVGDEGTITVAAGIFESGPRSSNARNGKNAYNEYYSSTDNSTGAGAKIAQSLSVQYYALDSDQSYSLSDSAATLPIIIPSVKSTPTETEWCHTVNGNMYFSSAIGDNYNSSIMQDDTYLYFTVEGDSVQNTAIAASNTSANYYYQYYVQLNNENSSNAGYTYFGVPKYDDNGNIIDRPTGESIYLATVYVYNKVKGTVAANNPYAAIEATGGNIYVRGGTYYSYFGEENTYCINANSGYMSVDSSSAISFYAYGNGVCVQCNYSTDNLQTRAGDADLRITNGNFYSELGNTISVSNGVMEIGTATFTKNAGTTSANRHTENGSVISVEGGRIEITSSATFNITGSGIDGIHAEATSFDANASALVDVKSITMTFNSTSDSTSSAHKYNRGIYSENGAISCTGITNVTLNGGSGSADNFGIYTLGGQITVNGDTTVYVSGEDSNGVYSTVKGGTTSDNVAGGAGRISITGNTFTCTVEMNDAANLSSTAISTAGGNINFNVGSADIDSDGLGITALNMPIDSETGNPDASTAIQGAGNITFESSTVTGATNTIDLDTPRGTGVYIYGGGVTIEEGITFYVTSDITAGGTTSTGYGWQSSKKSPTSYDGIYIQSGSLDSQGTLNVTHKGVANDISSYVDDNGETQSLTNDNAYIEHQIKSYAVRVEGTEGTTEDTKVTITGGTIYNNVGGGLFVSNGTVNLSNATVQARGVGGYIRYRFNSNWDYYASYDGGHAVEVENGILNVYSGQYSSAQGNGILVRNGTVTISDGIFKGNDVSSSAGASASYAFKMYGGTVTITNGTFGNSTELGNSTAGGAFVMGVSSTATAYIDGGDFVVNGSTGFSVWTNSNVRFGGEFGATVPYVSGVSTGLVIEDSGGNPSTITINNGVFESTQSSVSNNDYNKHGIAYLDRQATLTIENGQFVSNLGSGLYFSATPNNVSELIEISGGEFFGHERSSYWEDWSQHYYGGAISGASNFDTNGMFTNTFNGYTAGSGSYWVGWTRYNWSVNIIKEAQDSSTHKYNFSVSLYAEDGNNNKIPDTNYGIGTVGVVGVSVNDDYCAGYTYITTTNYGT